MSRIGNRELVIPSGVVVEVSGNLVKVNGPKGNLSLEVDNIITVKVDSSTVLVTRSNDIKTTKQLHGTINALIANMIEGVSKGYSKALEINGVGYRFQVSGRELVVNAGFSHQVKLPIPAGIEVELKSNTEIIVKGIDKCLVGEFAANIRDVRRPEPYKGKGIKYADEVIRRKEGKKAA